MARKAQRPRPKRGTDRRWHAWVTVGKKPDGRPHQVHVDRATYEECDDEIDKLWSNAKKGIRPEPSSKMPLPDWIDEYLETELPLRTRKPVSPDTIRKYRGWNTNWIRPHCTTTLERLRGSHLLRLYAAMGRSGLSGSSQNSTHYLIQGALEVALREGYVERNHAKLIDAPEEEHPPIEIFTVEEARKILGVLKGHPLEARYAVGMCLATRQGETLGLRWSSIDNAGPARRIRVEWQLGRRIYVHGCQARPCGRKRASDCKQRVLPLKRGEIQLHGGLILKPPKAGSRRAVPIPDEVSVLLAEHRRRWLERKVAAPRWAEHDLVFCTDEGQPLDPKVDQEVWRKVLATAGVDHRKLHVMRHTAATMIHAMSEIEVAQEVLGHSSKAMTERYSHLAEELVASEAAKAATQGNSRLLFG